MATVDRLRITRADHGRTMTLEEFREAEEEEGFRYELSRGVLEVSDIAETWHALIVCFFYDMISAYRRDHPGVIFLYGGGSEFRFELPTLQSSRHPDVAVTLRTTPRYDRGFRPASLAIEVVSEGKTLASAMTSRNAKNIWHMGCANTGSSIGSSVASWC